MKIASPLASLASFSLVLLVASSSALAKTKVDVSPPKVDPGDPILVRVSGTDRPEGKALGKALVFYPARGGHEAVFAVPLEQEPGKLHIGVDGAEDLSVEVRAHTFSELELVVEEEMANPPAAHRERIDADNAAIIGAARKADGDPQFTRAFARPKGKVASSFGQWRTFNDGHRSQHLGVDFPAGKGAPVKAINDGTVVLVRDCFLAGKVVVIAHGGGIASAYFHLDEATVDEGETIKRGARLGKAGATGRVTGSHLHLGVWVPGGWTDPDAFLKLKLRPKATAAARK
jgi:murein DD-endopeptidase MepM/ murein hydrolase activator NlpD